MLSEQEVKERAYKRAKEWRLKNKERMRELDRKRYKEKNEEHLNRAQKYREVNRDKINDKQNNGGSRKARLKHYYGITPEQYDEMLSNQGFSCAICGKHKDTQKMNLCVDHDHKTGKVRGLLCRKCNAALGHVEDDVEIMKRAIDYLLIHKTSE